MEVEKEATGKEKTLSKKKGFCGGDLAGARTQDPLLKREMLYQLSYQVIAFFVGLVP